MTKISAICPICGLHFPHLARGHHGPRVYCSMECYRRRPRHEFKPKTIDKPCLQCGEVFQASLKEHRRGNAKYCSPRCSQISKIGKRPREPNVTCAWCKTQFYRNESHKVNSKSGLFFCCRQCKDRAQTLDGLKEIHPPLYNNGLASYRKTALRIYRPRCMICGYDRCTGALEAHHLDRDRSNNKPKNLSILCANCHAEVHAGMHEHVNWKTLQAENLVTPEGIEPSSRS